ncbi:MAG: ABC transporter ATP-binding protein [Actinomycetota bacterium]
MTTTQEAGAVDGRTHEPLLKACGLEVDYDGIHALFGVDITICSDRVLGIIGPNGAGKSTLLKALVGMVSVSAGSVELHGSNITGASTAAIVRRGVTLVPEGREVYSGLTVAENLDLGALAARGHGGRYGSGESLRTWLLELFPVLGDRARQPAGTLSGGEQQMLVLARGLLAQPEVLLLDEPSLGLSPTMVERIVHGLSRIVEEFSLAVVLVEQNIGAAAALADSLMVLRAGRVVAELEPSGSGFDLEALDRAYWGRSK